MATGSPLLSLPNEILVHILSLLPLRSITACKRSCCRLRVVIKHSGLLRCRIRTMKSYIEDLSPPGLSTSDFLEHLKRWEKAWLTFGVGIEAATHAMNRPFLGPCEFLLRSGYLIEMRHGGTPGWSHLDLSLQRDLRGDQSTPQWTDIQLEATVSIGGWAMDVDRDLVAVSVLSRQARGSLEIRLLHFTTGTRHRSAAVPAVQLKFEGKYGKSFGTHIEVIGDNLVVFLSHGSPFRRYQTLYFIDWVRGQVKCRRRTSAGTYFPVLTSISKDILVLGRRKDWTLELCKITREDDDGAFVFRTLCLLKLPAIHPRARAHFTCLRRTTSSTPRSSALSRPSVLPFRSSLSDSILSFTVTVYRTEKSRSETRKFFFYALADTLRTLAKGIVGYAPRKRGGGNRARDFISSWLHRRADRSPPSPSIIIPWDKWGPTTTRWIIPSVNSAHQALSGMRCAITEPWKGKLRLLDFNPGRLGRVVAVREPGKDGQKVQERLAVTTPSIIPAGWSFQHDVKSSLPYYELKRSGVEGNFFMDDEWIAEIKSSVVFDSGVHSIGVHPVVGGGA